MISTQNADLYANIRVHVESGRIQHLFMLPTFMWTEEDHNLIKATLCFVASEILLAPEAGSPDDH